MKYYDTREQYGWITRILLVVIGLCFTGQIVLGFYMANLAKQRRFSIYLIHESIGLTLFVFAVIFVLWIIFNKKPATTFYIKWLQRLICVCLILTPLSGWIMSSFAGFPVDFWGWFDVTLPVPLSPYYEHIFSNIHIVTAFILTGSILLRLASILKYVFIDRKMV